MSFDPLSVPPHIPDLIHSTGLIPDKKHIQENPGHGDRVGVFLDVTTYHIRDVLPPSYLCPGQCQWERVTE